MNEKNSTIKKRGRPRIREKKSSRFTVWVNSQTKEKLAREARDLGIALSAYAGDRLSREREVYIAEADRKLLASQRFQLFKMGASLERIAGALEYFVDQKHTGPPPLEFLEQVSMEVCRDLERLDSSLYELRPFDPEANKVEE